MRDLGAVNKEMREKIFWVLHEVSVLEEVLRNIKDGLLEDLRTDAETP